MRTLWVFAICVGACDSPANRSPHDAAENDAGEVDATACTDPGTTGCACAPVTPGAGGMLVPSATITKLVSDPGRCRLYGLAGDRILVIDTKAKAELAPVMLSSPGNDVDVAADGSTLVVAHRGTHELTVVDPAQLTTKVLPLPVEPGPVEVTATGVAFYTTFDQFNYVHRIDLATGVDSTPTTLTVGYQVDIELSVDDTRLYIGESATSCDMDVYDVANGAFARVARTYWDNNFGFLGARRHVMVSRTGNAYFAGHQWLAHDMSKVTGSTIENVLAENDSGTVAIGSDHAWDVALSVPTVAHPSTVTAAAFAASGQEAWMVTATGLRYVATAELAGPELGVRERTPQPLASYQFEHAVYDPARDLIYASDSARHVVVVIDPVTLNLIAEIVVGSDPTDLAIDRAGGVLYVGHAEIDSIALVDLGTRAFTRFAHTPRLPFVLAAAGPGRVIVADRYNDAAPALFDVASGNAAPTTNKIDRAAIAVSADGTTLYAGSTGSSASDVFRFTITSNGLALTAKTTTSYPGGLRHLVLHPDGASLMFANRSISTSNLMVTKYLTSDVALAISPDGRVAVTGSRIVDAATGTEIGTLSASTASALVISADSQTLFLFRPNLIERVSLSQFQL